MRPIPSSEVLPPGRRLASVVRLTEGFERPAPASALVGCGLMVFACVTNVNLGPHAVAFKMVYAHWFGIAVVVLSARRLVATASEIRESLAPSVLQALPWFLALCLLVGAHGFVSNGLDYQRMAADYWTTDPFASSSRRLGLPVLAYTLGFEFKLYVVFWYGVLFTAFCTAFHMLVGRRLSPFEALSLATSSMLAYALEGPGYGEIAVLLVGIVAVRVRLTLPERIVAGTFMLATHETATPFVALALILTCDADDRRQWLVVFGFLYLAFAVSFLVTWHDDLAMALFRTQKPSVEVGETSLDLAVSHPALAGLGAALAYKLYWLPVLAACLRRDRRWLAALTLSSVALVFLGSDTSRLVQFSSLSLFLVVSDELQGWSPSARRRLAVSNLLVPSLYVATNAGPLWGPGLYSLYLKAGYALNLDLGRVFW